MGDRDTLLLGSHFTFAYPDTSLLAMQQFAATQHILTNPEGHVVEITKTDFEFEVKRNLLVLVEDG